jgi:hypothetical protein
MARKPGRLRRRFERVVLGTLMSLAAYFVERRLRRALGKHSLPHEERNDTAHIH